MNVILIYTYVHDRTRLVSSIVTQTQIVTQTRSKKDKDEERDVEEDDDDDENHEGEKKEKWRIKRHERAYYEDAIYKVGDS